MPLKAKTGYQVVCIINQIQAEKLNRIIKWRESKNNSEAIRWCIDEAYKAILSRVPPTMLENLTEL
jgi:hypothetical protein